MVMKYVNHVLQRGAGRVVTFGEDRWDNKTDDQTDGGDNPQDQPPKTELERVSQRDQYAGEKISFCLIHKNTPFGGFTQ